MSSKLWPGNWKLSQVDSETKLTLIFQDHQNGTLSLERENGESLCSTFYANFSVHTDVTNFELLFAQGKIRGDMYLKSHREMKLILKESSLVQLPLTRDDTEWQLSRS